MFNIVLFVCVDLFVFGVSCVWLLFRFVDSVGEMCVVGIVFVFYCWRGLRYITLYDLSLFMSMKVCLFVIVLIVLFVLDLLDLMLILDSWLYLFVFANLILLFLLVVFI